MTGVMMFGVLNVLLAAPAGSAAPVDDEAAVRAVVAGFARAGDARDLPALEAALHPEFRVAFTVKGKGGLTMMSRAAYLDAAKAGRIGGDQRALTVERVRLRGDLAEVEGRLAGAKADFEATWTLVRTPSGWRLLQDAVLFTPKG